MDPSARGHHCGRGFAVAGLGMTALGTRCVTKVSTDSAGCIGMQRGTQGSDGFGKAWRRGAMLHQWAASRVR
jgi:hypothetical protein